VRVVCAALVALLVGWGIGRWVRPQNSPPPAAENFDQDRPLGPRIVEGLRTGLGEVVDDTAPWIALGLGVAALMTPLLAADWLAQIPSSVEVGLYALLGIPIYVCASGATPLVAVLIFKGASPGAALAFLLTGPATNLTTFGVLTRLHGVRVAAWFGLGIMALAVALGYVVNQMIDLPPAVAIDEVGGHGWLSFEGVALLGLALLFALSLLRRGPRGFVGEIFSSDEEDECEHEHEHEHEDPCCQAADPCCQPEGRA
jgi:hypothetical protein